MTPDPERAEPARASGPWSKAGLGLAAWGVAWAAMLALDGTVDLASLALLLVLGAALGALWLPWVASMAVCAVAVLGFNVAFVPPRGLLAVSIHQHGLLLATMLAVAWLVTSMTARQRRLADAERRLALRASQLRRLGEALAASDEPAERSDVLIDLLQQTTGDRPALLVTAEAASHDHPAPDAATWSGEPDTDQRAGLWLSACDRAAMGPGTGRHATQPAWYLPLRGRAACFGAATLTPTRIDDATRAHAQALCDAMGTALERAVERRQATSALHEAETHRLRNTLLAAISHDHRTPLATILGAASSLREQSDKLSTMQRRALAATIVDETVRLTRLTENTLQLARLDAGPAQVRLDWESAEELVGTALSRSRQRSATHRVKGRVEPGLPLFRCNAVMMGQMLDNLLDNALRYGGDESPVELVARRIGDHIVLAVRDRGPGIAPPFRERVFDAFERADADGADDRGAGIGLAVSRAIARAHGGELSHRARGHGGSSFEFSVTIPPAP